MRRLLAVPLVVLSLAATPPRTPLGWGGGDLHEARQLALETGRPVLVFLTRADCPDCDSVERLLTEDPRVAPLTEPFIRVRSALEDPEGAATVAAMRARKFPAVFLLGPMGFKATGREGRVERAWLEEKLQVVARRHGHAMEPVPTLDAAHASQLLGRLESWGDVAGARRVRERLSLPPADDDETAGAAPGSLSPGSLSPGSLSYEEAHRRIMALDEPGEIRETSHRLAREMESRGQTEQALRALELGAGRLGFDPLSQARIGFLAARHQLSLERVVAELQEARNILPRSLPVLMGLARVLEVKGHPFQSMHALEAAAAFAPDDPWIALELHRIRTLIRLAGRASDNT